MIYDEIDKEFFGTIDFSALLTEIRAFEGSWPGLLPSLGDLALSHPFFNVHGDYVLDIEPRINGLRVNTRPPYGRQSQYDLNPRERESYRGTSRFFSTTTLH